eukprot:TRINITY_DN407_c0_g3_i2.p1 TRINITY_DN407_c0_g3~~TRINITY_DN407_c0_g3_i2.p1  ORF type:complete len:270 (-),score=80.16 TRINITY_DN407_c0_g3_i2:384-1085(-)
MGCTSTKQTSRSAADAKESGHEGTNKTGNQVPAETLLESRQNCHKVSAGANGAQEPGQAEQAKTGENPPAGEVTHRCDALKASSGAGEQEPGQAEQAETGEILPSTELVESHSDKVTKVNSNVMLVEFTPEEHEDDEQDEVKQPSAHTPCKSMRKVTPWHGGGAALQLDDDEIDEDDAEQEQAAESEEHVKEHSERKAVRKATPWHKGGEALESDHDDDDQEKGSPFIISGPR